MKIKKTMAIIIAIIAIAGFGVWQQFGAPEAAPIGKVCTQEVKLCSDGSYVGRAGPNCEFAPCPSGQQRQCDGPSDTSCPTSFECVPECGPPVVRDSDNALPKYSCRLKGEIRRCPICLAKNTLIDTPLGAMPAQDIQKGTPVWTLTASGQRAIGVVIEISKTPVPPEHKMVELVLGDGRALFVSPGHPTVDGRTVGDLIAGDWYDGARVVSSKRVLYGDEATYDILPSGETGFYFANGIILESTLHH